MADTAQKMLEAFDTLPVNEQHQVPVQLLQRTVGVSYAPVAESGLLQAADEVFLGLDRDEARK